MARHVILNPYSIVKDQDVISHAPGTRLAPTAQKQNRPLRLVSKEPVRYLKRPNVRRGYSIRDSSLGTRLPNPVAIATTAAVSRAVRSNCLIMVLFIYVAT